jgi:hypothetical protein
MVACRRGNNSVSKLQEASASAGSLFCFEVGVMASGYEHEPDFGGPKSVWRSMILPLIVVLAALALYSFGVL